MVKLSERLKAIADYINDNETIADIGTDHGFLPINLYDCGKSPHVILSDINMGPLEKARENIDKLCPNIDFDIRQGNGLSTIKSGEVDVIVIAGMGGLLIADILGDDPEKSRSYKRYILQPRNAQDKLRRWLIENDFSIIDEKLVKEGKYICEIIVAEPKSRDFDQTHNFVCDSVEELVYEISPLLYKNRDILLSEFIKNKIRIEKKIINNILVGSADKNYDKLKVAELRLLSLQRLLERSNSDEYEY